MTSATNELNDVAESMKDYYGKLITKMSCITVKGVGRNITRGRVEPKEKRTKNSTFKPLSTISVYMYENPYVRIMSVKNNCKKKIKKRKKLCQK